MSQYHHSLVILVSAQEVQSTVQASIESSLAPLAATITDRPGMWISTVELLSCLLGNAKERCSCWQQTEAAAWSVFPAPAEPIISRAAAGRPALNSRQYNSRLPDTNLAPQISLVQESRNIAFHSTVEAELYWDCSKYHRLQILEYK